MSHIIRVVKIKMNQMTNIIFSKGTPKGLKARISKGVPSFPNVLGKKLNLHQTNIIINRSEQAIGQSGT